MIDSLVFIEVSIPRRSAVSVRQVSGLRFKIKHSGHKVPAVLVASDPCSWKGRKTICHATVRNLRTRNGGNIWTVILQPSNRSQPTHGLPTMDVTGEIQIPPLS